MKTKKDNEPVEYDFYYADIQVTVKVIPHKEHPLDKLTQNERQALSQIMYLAINTYKFTRALYLSDDY